MKNKPQQPAARERLAARVRIIGVTLDSLVRRRPIETVAEERTFRLGHIARLTRLPESSIRDIAGHSFQDIVVPGHVVGFIRGRFVVARDFSPRAKS